MQYRTVRSSAVAALIALAFLAFLTLSTTMGRFAEVPSPKYRRMRRRSIPA